MARNKISDLRDHLFEMIERVKEAETTEDLQVELKKAKAVSAIATTVIEAGKLELAYLDKIDGQKKPVFFEENASLLPSKTA